MSARAYHYAMAETLLAEGREVVRRISEYADMRKPLIATVEDDLSELDRETRDDLTRRMDELGKKAMGIWAQAQAHATLSLATENTEMSADDYSPGTER